MFECIELVHGKNVCATLLDSQNYIASIFSDVRCWIVSYQVSAVQETKCVNGGLEILMWFWTSGRQWDKSWMWSLEWGTLNRATREAIRPICNLNIDIWCVTLIRTRFTAISRYLPPLKRFYWIYLDSKPILIPLTKRTIQQSILNS